MLYVHYLGRNKIWHGVKAYTKRLDIPKFLCEWSIAEGIDFFCKTSLPETKKCFHQSAAVCRLMMGIVQVLDGPVHSVVVPYFRGKHRETPARFPITTE